MPVTSCFRRHAKVFGLLATLATSSSEITAIAYFVIYYRDFVKGDASNSNKEEEDKGGGNEKEGLVRVKIILGHFSIKRII